MFRWFFYIRDVWIQFRKEWDKPLPPLEDLQPSPLTATWETRVELEPKVFIQTVRDKKPTTIFSQFSREDDSGKYGYVWFVSDDNVKTITWGDHRNWDSNGILDQLSDLYRYEEIAGTLKDEYSPRKYSLVEI